MALFWHGVRRFTEDVDILVTAGSLKKIHNQLDGLGYIPSFQGSRQLRDADNNVRIEFLITGQFPRDGKPKPVAFPDPDNVSVEMNGIRFLRLENLIELKLASGMSAGGTAIEACLGMCLNSHRFAVAATPASPFSVGKPRGDAGVAATCDCPGDRRLYK